MSEPVGGTLALKRRGHRLVIFCFVCYFEFVCKYILHIFCHINEQHGCGFKRLGSLKTYEPRAQHNKA